MSVVSIEQQAFASCVMLDFARIDMAHGTILDGCFDGCTSLSVVILRDINCLRNLFRHSECFDECRNFKGFLFDKEVSRAVLPHMLMKLGKEEIRRVCHVVFPSSSSKMSFFHELVKNHLKEKYANFAT